MGKRNEKRKKNENKRKQDKLGVFAGFLGVRDIKAWYRRV
jgi:hypothetical protein